MIRLAIEMPLGVRIVPPRSRSRYSSRLTQRASAISTGSIVSSVSRVVASKPIMTDDGNGHGWLPR